MPFRADPVLVKLGRALRWEWANELDCAVPLWLAAKVHTSGWLAPSMLLPVLAALFDDNGLRRRRFIRL
jgi:hypothetical protein